MGRSNPDRCGWSWRALVAEYGEEAALWVLATKEGYGEFEGQHALSPEFAANGNGGMLALHTPQDTTGPWDVVHDELRRPALGPVVTAAVTAATAPVMPWFDNWWMDDLYLARTEPEFNARAQIRRAAERAAARKNHERRPKVRMPGSMRPDRWLWEPTLDPLR